MNALSTYLGRLLKNQLSLFGGNTEKQHRQDGGEGGGAPAKTPAAAPARRQVKFPGMRSMPNLFDEAHKEGDTKTEDGRRYRLEAKTFGKPRWVKADSEQAPAKAIHGSESKVATNTDERGLETAGVGQNGHEPADSEAAPEVKDAGPVKQSRLMAAINKRVKSVLPKKATKPGDDLFTSAPEPEREKPAEAAAPAAGGKKQRAKAKDFEFGVPSSIVGLKKKREEWNAKALEILRTKDDSELTAEDRQALARYSGNGGTDEFSLNEFYTSQEVAGFMWNLLGKYGFKGGHVLEPSAGTGVFIHTKPEDTIVTAVELSEVSSRIAQVLHPDDDVRNSSLERFAKANSQSFDAVIGNVPFGPRGAHAADHKPRIKTAEDYFLDTAIDQVKPGGLVALIVPTGVMDNKSGRKFRTAITERAEFLGAYRMPNTAFKHAGTSVTTDIVLLRKHPQAVDDALLNAEDGSPEKAKMEMALCNKEFENGKYFDGTGAKNVWGESTLGGRFGTSVVVKGVISQEHFDAALQAPVTAGIDYEAVTGQAIAPEATKLQVGTTKMINGRMYVLNENHRWERVHDAEDPDVERERKLNVDLAAFGVDNRQELHRHISDVSLRADMDPAQAQMAADYLSVVSHEDLADRDELETAITAALKASQDAVSPEEAEKLYRATIMGAEIERLQRSVEAGHYPDYQRYEQLVSMLADYKEKYGNPARDKKLLAMATSSRPLSRFVASVQDSGEISDFLLNPEQYMPEREARAFNPLNFASIVRFLDSEEQPATLEAISRAYAGVAEGRELEALLLADPEVGYLPEAGRFAPIEKVVTGDVYSKLDAWDPMIKKMEADQDPADAAKLAKLRAQRDELFKRSGYRSIEDMSIGLGSKWIPINVLNEFLHSQDMKGLVYDEKTSVWDVDTYDSEGKEGFTEGGTLRDIIRTLNNLGLTHGSDNKNREAGLKELAESYKTFLATHADRDMLEDRYNRTFNGHVEESHSDEPFKIDKLADGFDLNRYHYAAIRRMTAEGRGILAYGVGLGKTFAAISMLLYRKQRGEIKKPLVAVPKSVLANWISEVRKLTAGKDVRMMVVGMTEKRDAAGNVMKDEKGNSIWSDDTGDTVQKKLQQVAQNDYDLVLMTRDNLDLLTLGEDRTRSYMDHVINQVTRSQYEDKFEKREKGAGGKFDTAKFKANLEANFMTRFKGGEEKVKNTTFEELGVDCIVADEAHAYKNLFGLTGRPVKWALGQPDTQRSMRMFMFSRYIREQNAGKNVYFLTATPTTNNPLEAYNMMQYIAPEEFEKRSMTSVKDFFDQFGEVKDVAITTTSGEKKEVQGLVGFKNLRELRSMFMRYTNMKSAKEVGLKIPEERGDYKLSDMSKLQRKIYGDLRKRAADVMKKEKDDGTPNDDHLFSILSDMQKASVSLGLLARTGSIYKPKLSAAQIEAEGLSPKMRTFTEQAIQSHRNGGKQLVFTEYKEHQDEIKKALIEGGVPAEDIFIVNADTVPSSAKRQAISKAYNEGRYKIVIGNATMGEGMNFQIGTTDIHHLMLPWTPAAIEQRNGRGVRQGNKVDGVNVSYHMTRGTFDQMLNAGLQRKRGWLNALWKGGEDSAQSEDTGRNFSPEEMEIMLSDDPEAARIRAEAAGADGTRRMHDGYKSQALKTFNQYQNTLAQYAKLAAKDRAGERGAGLKAKIDATKRGLLSNQYFEHKGLLEDERPAYIDADRHLAIQHDQLFTAANGDWKTHGIYKFTEIDPVKRTTRMECVYQGKGEAAVNTYTTPGESTGMDYRDLKTKVPSGMSTPSVPMDEVEDAIIETMESARSIAQLRPETVEKNRERLAKFMIENGKERSWGDDYSGGKHRHFIPVKDKATGKVVYATKGDFEPQKRWKSGGEVEEPAKFTAADVYLPVDRAQWEHDIMAQAAEHYTSSYSYGHRQKHDNTPNQVKLAQDLFGYNWVARAKKDPTIKWGYNGRGY